MRARDVGGTAPCQSTLRTRLASLTEVSKNLLWPGPGRAAARWILVAAASSGTWAIMNLNEVLHWNGSAWAQVSVPSPGGTAGGDVSQLFGVRCFLASDCWAVGFYQPNGGAGVNQALHWNGRRWSVVPTPAPGGSVSGDTSELFEVVCVSSANCWAVGEYGVESPTELFLNQVLHWNGRRWALKTVPNPGGTATNDISELNSVRCTSATTCLAVGSYGTLNSPTTLLNQALQWNGTTWSQVTTPNPGGTTGDGTFNDLVGLACSASANCWAVGSYGTFTFPGTSLNQALHWNGSAWSQVTVPEPNGTGSGGSQQLTFANCKSATNCWAVGNYGSPLSPGFVLNLALHWDGGKWSLVDTPEPGGAASGDTNNLNAVRCTSTTNCWAVGLAQPSGGSQFGTALHWNGTTWSTG